MPASPNSGYVGVWRAIVTSNTADTSGTGAVEVAIPSLSGFDAAGSPETWGMAYPIISSDTLSVPDVDDRLLVIFLEGQVDRVYYFGKITEASVEEQRVYSGRGPEVEGIVNAAATRHGIPPALLRAIVCRESAWDPSAYNTKASSQQHRKYVKGARKVQGGKDLSTHALAEDKTKWGAYGLCQIMLVTAMDRGFPFDADASTLLDPSTNCDLAAQLLKIFYTRAKGDIRATAAAYHSGWGNVGTGVGKAAKVNDVSRWASDSQSYSKDVVNFYHAESKGSLRFNKTLPNEVLGGESASAHAINKGSATFDIPGISFTYAGDLTSTTLTQSSSSSQPRSFASTTYPFNSISFNSGGLRREMDRTPGKERLGWFHPAGAYREVGPGGQNSERYNSTFKVVDGPDRRRTGPATLVVKGTKDEYVEGSATLSTGRFIHNVRGQLDEICRARKTVEITGKYKRRSGRDTLVSAGGQYNIVGGNDVGIAAGGDMLLVGQQNGEITFSNNFKASCIGKGAILGVSPTIKMGFRDAELAGFNAGPCVAPFVEIGAVSAAQAAIYPAPMPLVNVNILPTIASFLDMYATALNTAAGAAVPQTMAPVFTALGLAVEGIAGMIRGIYATGNTTSAAAPTFAGIYPAIGSVPTLAQLPDLISSLLSGDTDAVIEALSKTMPNPYLATVATRGN